MTERYQSPTDLSARLAAVLEPLAHRCDEPWCVAMRLDTPAEWADRCLTDANAALALVTEHGPGAWTVECDPNNDSFQRYFAMLWTSPVLDDNPYIDAFGSTFEHALMAAYVEWAESEAGT